MRLRHFLLVGLVTLLAAPASAGAAPGVSAFFYPWYGTPAVDGGYQHWQTARARPARVRRLELLAGARALFELGPVRARSRRWRRCGAPGSPTWPCRGGAGARSRTRGCRPSEPPRAPQHLTVSVHIEPYEGRDVASTADDIAYLRGRGITTFFVYRPFELDPASWAP